ncbi:MAG TPA: mannose-1-phosphate guanylyltransferase [Chthoniobacterales bacterium]|nr:mannose-1-phosphate guanylyltransferase [Chthoniobacterales bacterium]
MSNNFYALVLAGGSGTRFWPLSRREKPKQLLALFNENTLLEETVLRLSGLVPPENILILTNQEQEDAVRKLLPGHPQKNIFAEPARRDTAAAIALGVGLIAARDSDATMVVLPADHLIKDKVSFQADLRAGATVASKTGDLVTIGITPTWACPGYGYIERGKKVDGPVSDFFEVVRFREKPDTDLAETFLRSGNFFWNAGIFIWSVKAILTELNRHAPALGEFISAIRHSSDPTRVIGDRFPTLPKISVDYAVMEKASRVVVKAASFDWDDVGSWTSIAKYLEQLPNGNATNTAVSVEGSNNNIVFSDQKIHLALVGVNDLIVVQTRDSILVCHRHDVERVKSLVGTLPEQFQ